MDISARLLITELAPWSSLVQRAGRAARDAKDPPAPVIVVGAVPTSDKDALPYDIASLAAADLGWQRLMDETGSETDAEGQPDASLRALTAFEDRLRAHDPEFLQTLYPYQPAQLVQRRDVDDLFDTTADLTGADLDVSAFIRSGEERDVSMAWRGEINDCDGQRTLSRDLVHTIGRDELCPVRLDQARKWLQDSKRTGYALDYIDGVWRRIDRDDRLAPGTIVLVAAKHGGYDAERGWNPKVTTPVEPVPATPQPTGPQPEDQIADRFDDTAAAQDDDSASIARSFKTIATHGRETAEIAAELCRALDIPEPYASELCLAARWHDTGKAHPVFQNAIKAEARAQAAPFAERRDLAKAPQGAWRRPAYADRPGFRHELASALALFELLHRASPEHPALLGPHRELLEATNVEQVLPAPDDRVAAEHPLAAELVALDAGAFDRVAYLVCSHHGKVRCAMTSTPRDHDAGNNAMCGVTDDDELPGFELCDGRGQIAAVPDLRLWLDPAAMGLSARYGASWTERVANLREHLGPFALAYLEAILRAADARASKLQTEDPLQ